MCIFLCLFIEKKCKSLEEEWVKYFEKCKSSIKMSFRPMLADTKAGLSRKWSELRIQDNDAMLISEFYMHW